MKWRCPECGKPQERNDPPCDNCGHHKFERAVVPAPQADDSHEQFVWACADCGRHHQRNNPPCSRCGGANFEKKVLEYDDFETGGGSPSYLDLVGRQEIAALAVVVALVAVGVAGYLGVVQIPGITPQPPPTAENVPGDAERLGSTELSAVESTLLNDLNARRDGAPLRRVEDLDRMATYIAGQSVKAIVDGGEPDLTQDELGRFPTPCAELPNTGIYVSGVARTDDAAEEVAADVQLQTSAGEPELTANRVSNVGIDAHALPDGRLFVMVLYC